MFVHCYVLLWFYAEMYHIVELSSNKQVSSRQSSSAGTQLKPPEALTVTCSVFINGLLGRNSVSTCLAWGVIR